MSSLDLPRYQLNLCTLNLAVSEAEKRAYECVVEQVVVSSSAILNNEGWPANREQFQQLRQAITQVREVEYTHEDQRYAADYVTNICLRDISQNMGLLERYPGKHQTYRALLCLRQALAEGALEQRTLSLAQALTERCVSLRSSHYAGSKRLELLVGECFAMLQHVAALVPAGRWQQAATDGYSGSMAELSAARTELLEELSESLCPVDSSDSQALKASQAWVYAEIQYCVSAEAAVDQEELERVAVRLYDYLLSSAEQGVLDCALFRKHLSCIDLLNNMLGDDQLYAQVDYSPASQHSMAPTAMPILILTQLKHNISVEDMGWVMPNMAAVKYGLPLAMRCFKVDNADAWLLRLCGGDPTTIPPLETLLERINFLEKHALSELVIALLEKEFLTIEDEHNAIINIKSTFTKQESPFTQLFEVFEKLIKALPTGQKVSFNVSRCQKEDLTFVKELLVRYLYDYAVCLPCDNAFDKHDWMKVERRLLAKQGYLEVPARGMPAKRAVDLWKGALLIIHGPDSPLEEWQRFCDRYMSATLPICFDLASYANVSCSQMLSMAARLPTLSHMHLTDDFTFDEPDFYMQIITEQMVFGNVKKLSLELYDALILQLEGLLKAFPRLEVLALGRSALQDEKPYSVAQQKMVLEHLSALPGLQELYCDIKLYSIGDALQLLEEGQRLKKINLYIETEDSQALNKALADLTALAEGRTAWRVHYSVKHENEKFEVEVQLTR